MMTILQDFKDQIQSVIKSEMKLHLEEKLQIIEEKCNVILVRIPILEIRTKEMEKIKSDLELEIVKRKENENHLMECVEKLMEEIVQLNLKLVMLEEKIEEKAKVVVTKTELVVTQAEQQNFDLDPDAPPVLSPQVSIVPQVEEEKESSHYSSLDSSQRSQVQNLEEITNTNDESTNAEEIFNEVGDSGDLDLDHDDDSSTSIFSENTGTDTNARIMNTTHFHVKTTTKSNLRPKHGFLQRLLDENGKCRFSCNCGKTYKGKQSLIRHINIFTGRIFPCLKCSRRFKTYHILSNHMSNKHPTRSFK